MAHIEAWFLLIYAKWMNWRARRATQKALAMFEKLLRDDPDNVALQEKYHQLRRMLINNKVQKNEINDLRDRYKD